ncbi:MAG TPA: zf-HC2 domain-containing protein [Bryobacteraceae bacterium]|nr:zf-HC2 domain-containing protein [Bryobacteraceae bacterium]
MSLQQPREGCKEVFAKLSEYLDMELPPDACEELEAHLEGCPPCIEFVASLRKTVDLCRRYSPAELPGALNETARQELQEAYERSLAARGRG